MLGTRHSLDEFVAALKLIDFEREPAAPMAALFAQARLDAGALQDYLRFEPGRYTRNLVVRDERFEFLVLCWSPGSASAVHDHGGQNCYMLVQRGSLGVENFELRSGGRQPGHARISSAGSTLLRPGAIDVRNSARDLHRVSAALEPAISLHVYAKPIDRFLIFDPADRSCRSVRSHYDSTPPRYARTIGPDAQLAGRKSY